MWEGPSNHPTLATRNAWLDLVGLAYLILPVWLPLTTMAAVMGFQTSPSLSFTTVGISLSPTLCLRKTSSSVTGDTANPPDLKKLKKAGIVSLVA
jgi:hypothetical protein